MADGSDVAPTPEIPKRQHGRLLTLLLFLALFASACSATPSWTPIESAVAADAAQVEDSSTATDAAPDALAFIDDDASDDTNAAELAAEEEPPAPSQVFCSASANIWIHSAALNLLDDQANDEMTRIAMANVAEWIERSALFDEPAGPDHTEMFVAFTELQNTVETDFDYDWVALQSSSAYANSNAAQTYEASRSELVSFLNDDCDDQSMSDLRADATARADELIAEFQADPSTVVESDSLPGHSIFTHASGRLIASFPTAWEYEERTGNAVVELVAAPDIARFLAGEAIDGVHLQLIEAATIEDFRAKIDATFTASSCERTNVLEDSGTVRQNITQTFVCTDHGASIIGQFSESRELGLIIEASFDRVDASRADLIRLASIANSALWS